MNGAGKKNRIASVTRAAKLLAPRNRKELRQWISIFLNMRMPETNVCSHHQTPLDYLEHSFFEAYEGSGDAVVWACRGGGKTMIGAVATLLDLLFKPGVQVRILGGSLEQSEKMYAYLTRLIQRSFPLQLASPPTQRRLLLKNGSQVQVLAQSDHSVRGQRVQKLRCDEIELFDPEVWQAAQLTTRSTANKEGANKGGGIRGTVEAFSTMHRTAGLMQEILAASRGGREGTSSRRIFAWCLWDVIETCPSVRSCESCTLLQTCQGLAKQADGFIRIDDAIAMQSRVSQSTWDHEMLCLPPKLENAVFPAFDRKLHLRGGAANVASLVSGAQIRLDDRDLRFEQFVCGVDFGYKHAFVCLRLAMLRENGKRVVWVVDEMVTHLQVIAKNAADMRARGWENDLLYCDIAGEQANRQTALSDSRVLRDAGFRTRSSPMRIDQGIAAIASLLQPAEGPPRLLIDPRCTQLIAAMEGYACNKHGDPIKDGNHDHLIDALRYALVNHDAASKTERRYY
ncbi:MAG: hypothetical protein FWD61_17370 [Phycisphaerales bacterium]|nr:hypothetical protein [Phycisphaerales bacterium]